MTFVFVLLCGIATCTDEVETRIVSAVVAQETISADVGREVLRRRFASLVAEGRSDDMIELVLELLDHARRSNDALTARLGQLLRQLAGRKSEKVDPAQLALLLESLGAAVPPSAREAAAEASAKDDTVAQPEAPAKRTGHKGRRPLPANLPRERVDVLVPEPLRVCLECGKAKACIGHIRSEVLEFSPAHFKIVEERREKLACTDCESGVVSAPSEKVMDRGRPGPGLLAHIVVGKFQDGLPLYRQAQGYRRLGVTLSESTLGDWSGFSCDVLLPIARRLKHLLLAKDYLQGDDTGLRVLDRDHVDGVKRGHMWAYVASKMVVFDYTPDWKKEGPALFLQDFHGMLQADGYAGFDEALRLPRGSPPEDGELRRLGCAMHIRRKFENAADAGDTRGAVALAYFAKIYRIEASCKTDGLEPEQRHARRQEQSVPVVDELYKWVRDLHPTAVPGTLLHDATRYALNQEQRWRRCFTNGRFEIDNGEPERQLRRVALGRKNFLFAGSDKGAERIAVAYTILGTCHMNGINPLAYLTDVISKLQAGWPKARLDEILPQNWTPPA